MLEGTLWKGNSEVTILEQNGTVIVYLWDTPHIFRIDVEKPSRYGFGRGYIDSKLRDFITKQLGEVFEV